MFDMKEYQKKYRKDNLTYFRDKMRKYREKQILDLANNKRIFKYK